MKREEMLKMKNQYTKLLEIDKKCTKSQVSKSDAIRRQDLVFRRQDLVFRSNPTRRFFCFWAVLVNLVSDVQIFFSFLRFLSIWFSDIVQRADFLVFHSFCQFGFPTYSNIQILSLFGGADTERRKQNKVNAFQIWQTCSSNSWRIFHNYLLLVALWNRLFGNSLTMAFKCGNAWPPWFQEPTSCW